MDETFGGIRVEYKVAGGPVKVSGTGAPEGLELFGLYSALRSIYNQKNLIHGRDAETAILRKITLPVVKADKRL